MFFNCSSLISINLSSFDTRNVKSMRDMFSECYSLKKENIKINDKDQQLNEKLIKIINEYIKK